MTNKLLLKGFEVELFTGLLSGEHVGIATDVIKEFDDFVNEPDHRNLEFITFPKEKYEDLKKVLIEPRSRLRVWLASRDLTILPCSTLSLGDSRKFQRSDPFNTYHELIEKNYGTKVVTSSVHINLGIEELTGLFSALRLIRCEAALFLALSASSPFLDRSSTGVHSQRWMQFPRTPQSVPLFLDHKHYITWIEEHLEKGEMWNVRHFWSSIRPNGPARPYELNRLELRICDLITDCDLLLAVTALFELRVLSILNNPARLDPLKASKLSTDELAVLSDLNDVSAAKYSLDASLNHWVDGRSIICRDWIEQLIQEVMPLASDMGMTHLLSPLRVILDEGNQAMQWLKGYSAGNSIEALLQTSIAAMETEEKAFNEPHDFLR
tara:strand:- start:1056 stop:2198 length:1143 start_codon:yes stop_codon:yes gene_type:complete